MDNTDWECQHFYRNFTPKASSNIFRLCAQLGWKIFTIDSDSSMHFSNQYIPGSCLQQFFSGIHSTSIQNVYLNYNYLPSLLTLLTPVIFSNLIVLQLSGNKITSIHPIQQLHSSQLTIILLDDNLITSVRSLTKVDLKSLEHLSLNKNYINDMSELSRLNSTNLSILQVRENASKSDGLSLIMKNQSKSLKQINQCHSKIVLGKTLQIKRAIYNRYPHFERYNFS